MIFSLSNQPFNNNIAILESKIIYFCLRSNFCDRTTLMSLIQHINYIALYRRVFKIANRYKIGLERLAFVDLIQSHFLSKFTLLGEHITGVLAAVSVFSNPLTKFMVPHVPYSTLKSQLFIVCFILRFWLYYFTILLQQFFLAKIQLRFFAIIFIFPTHTIYYQIDSQFN